MFKQLWVSNIIFGDKRCYNNRCCL